MDSMDGGGQVSGWMDGQIREMDDGGRKEREKVGETGQGG